jgi:hypothetical protein
MGHNWIELVQPPTTRMMSHTRSVTAVGAVPTIIHSSHRGQKNFTRHPAR